MRFLWEGWFSLGGTRWFPFPTAERRHLLVGEQRSLRHIFREGSRKADFLLMFGAVRKCASKLSRSARREFLTKILVDELVFNAVQVPHRFDRSSVAALQTEPALSQQPAASSHELFAFLFRLIPSS